VICRVSQANRVFLTILSGRRHFLETRRSTLRVLLESVVLPGAPIRRLVENPINLRLRGGPTLSMSSTLPGHRPAIIWLTGLSGAGKSTLAVAVRERLTDAGILAMDLDGDALRAGLNVGLGFSEDDRRENVRRAGEVALLMAEKGAIVIVSLISPYREHRAQVAERAADCEITWAEIFVNASLAECERRDPKSLYRRARAGQLPEFTGIDSPYEPPLRPALEIRTDRETIERSIERLFQLALSLAHPDSVQDRYQVA
jgi:adenylylsulfate kinase